MKRKILTMMCLSIVGMTNANAQYDPYPSWWIPLDNPPAHCLSGIHLYSPQPNATLIVTAPTMVTGAVQAIYSGCTHQVDYGADFYVKSQTNPSDSFDCNASGVSAYTCSLYFTKTGTYTVTAKILDPYGSKTATNYATVIVN